jgi:hypothetical protein
MPSSGNGSAIRSARRAGRDRERRGVVDRVRSQPRRTVRLPHRDAVVRHARNIKRVLILNCIPIAWPAALVMACMMARKAD